MDTGAPRRGLSAYMYFSQAHRKTVQDENPNASFSQIGKVLSDKWKDMSEKVTSGRHEREGEAALYCPS